MESLREKYISGFFKAVCEKYGIEIDPHLKSSAVGDIDMCAFGFAQKKSLEELKEMYEKPQKYIGRFVGYAKRRDAWEC